MTFIISRVTTFKYSRKKRRIYIFIVVIKPPWGVWGYRHKGRVLYLNSKLDDLLYPVAFKILFQNDLDIAVIS